MAQIADLHAHITWDSEPTEGAKNLVRAEVHKVLQETFQEPSWFTELIQAEVRKALQEKVMPSRMQIGSRN